MDNEPKKNEESIFYEALNMSEDERESYLDQACGDDVQLLHRVQALLKGHAIDDSFLESPALDFDMLSDSDAHFSVPGTVIDRYTLLEKIGEGGMAVVYLAEQTQPIRRKVALKIIKLGMDTKQVIARFEAERQALAMMDHPNIARVFDAGATKTGRPYFVMELVKGVSITKYCDKEKLDINSRLRLFVQICNAIQHAHQKGIIHRDIKPSNIVVDIQDGKAVPKVIDFGVAKAVSMPLTEKTVFTQLGQLIGTPEYMSPEQADLKENDIDTRTDIYSLGIVLYELLAGILPFEPQKLREGGYAEIQRIIREQEPPRPSTKLTHLGKTAIKVALRRQTELSTLIKDLHSELEWIPLMAIRKNREMRYMTALDLSEDVQNYLVGNPLTAGPESFAYKFKKYIKKRKGLVVAVGSTVIVLIAGIVVSTVMYFQVKQAHEKEIVARQQAEIHFLQAKRVVDQMLTQVADKLPYHPGGMPKQLDSPQVTQIKQAMLEDALKYYEEFLENRRSDPLVRYEAAEAYLRVGDINRLIQKYERAEETYGFAARLLEDLSAEFPKEADYYLNLGFTYQKLANLLVETERLEDAEKAFRESIAVCSKGIELNPDHPSIWGMRGGTYLVMEQWDKAAADYTRAIKLNPNEWLFWRERGFVYVQIKQWDKALVDYSMIIKLQPNIGDGYVRRAGIYVHLGQWDKALADCTTAIELEPDEWWSWHERGYAYMQLGLWKEVVSDYSSMIKLKPDNSDGYSRRAIAYMHLGRSEDALSDIQQLNNLMEASSDNPDLLNSLAWWQATCQENEIRDGIKAIEHATKACELTNWQNAMYVDTLAAAYAEAGDFDKAVKWQKKAIDLLPDETSDNMLHGFELRLGLYENDKSYREKW